MALEVVETTLFRGTGFRIGRFVCPAGSRRWRSVNLIPPTTHVAFPWRTVVITHVGRDPVLATPNHVMFYNPGQEYRRALHHAEGDRCLFIELENDLVTEVTGIRGAEIPFVHGPSDAETYFLQHALVTHLAREPQPDGLLVEETAHLILERAFGNALAFHGARRRRGRAETLRGHRVLVERTKSLVAMRAHEQLTLADLARDLHASEFHLARLFRAGTGFSVHEYRTQLRLRSALERIGSSELRLADLACELGFASHSHFTDSFRTAFGVAPSRATRAELRELRRIVEARLADRS